MKAPFPRTEADRLQVLLDYGIVESPFEAAFERITNMAARLLGVPIALISLVDAERHLIQSHLGLDGHPPERQLSFNTHVLLSNEMLLVPDATVDPRFKDHSSVTGPPCIRFYAGTPLQAPNGQNLGVLYAIDTVPRQFSAEQQNTLVDLGSMVVDEIELRRVVHDLRQSEATLRESEAALRENEAALRETEIALRESLRKNSQLIMAVMNLSSGVVITDPSFPDNPLVFANEGFSQMTGYKLEDALGLNCRFLQGPETDPAIIAQMHAAIAERRSF